MSMTTSEQMLFCIDLISTTFALASTCMPLGPSTFVNGSNPIHWTEYNITRRALSTSVTLEFAFRTNQYRYYYLDDISVININTSSVELLRNADFRDSNSLFTGWMLSCDNTCNGTGARIVFNGMCRMSYGYCVEVNCYSNQAVIFLSQTISSVINQTYIITFWLRTNGTSASDQTKFDVTFA